MPNRRRAPRSSRALLAVFVVGFTLWQVVRATYQSAIWDEPIHLTAGYAALTGDFRVDPSHPPLVRAWAALPLLVLPHEPFATGEIDRTPPSQWSPRGYAFARAFLFARGLQGDRLLLAGRAMIAIWGVVLALLMFVWAREWLGPAGAVLTLLLFALEPNLRAHSTLVTTDFGVTVLTFGTVYALWRLARRPTAGNVAAVVICVALAIVTKFSAVILIPIVIVLLLVVTIRRLVPWTRAAMTVAVMVAAVFVAIWAAYGFRYAPSGEPGWLFPPFEGESGSLAFAATLRWLDRWHLLPNAFAQGFLFSIDTARELPAYLAGEVKVGGWWYYFPTALVLKTPLAILALAGGGIVMAWRRRDASDTLAPIFLLVASGLWMMVAATSGVNIGVRHILPIFPFIVLLAASAGTRLLSQPGTTRIAGVVALVVIALEVGRSEPYPLSFFNAIAGGPANGGRYLADSNLDWGGNLKALDRWMREHDVATVNLAYFGSVDPNVYGVRATYLPSSATFLADRFSRPRLPGYVAISGTVLSGVYLPEWWRRYYAGFRDRSPDALIGNSMRVYWVDRWPEPSMHRISGPALRTLAEGLLFGMHWPEHAIVHYREYLQQSAKDVDAWNGLSLALAQSGRLAEAVDGFRHVLTLNPSDSDARRNIVLLEQQLGVRPPPFN